MQCLNIDTIGPLPKSKFGYEDILVIIDTFTRWVEIYPTTNTTAIEATKCLIQHFGRYGIPSVLRSDRGSQFVNEIIESLLRVLRIENKLSIAYSKEENAIVERANQEVMRHLRAFIMDVNILSEWEDYLPLVQRIINSKIHASTGVAPAHLLFGSQFDLDRVILNNHAVDDDIPLADYVTDMMQKQKKAIEIAEKHLRYQDMVHMAYADKPTVANFPPDSYVLLNYAESEQRPHKLAPARRGPYRVIQSVGSKYELLDLVTMKTKTVHESLLQPFRYDRSHTNPRLIANQDRQFGDVHKIHRHTGQVRKVSTLQFETEWEGFPNPGDYTWKNLRDNQCLHQYLIAKSLARLIPTEFHHHYNIVVEPKRTRKRKNTK